MQPQSVFFLAAGFGTRLRPLTDQVPKALVPLGDTPQLLRLAARFSGLPQVVNAHFLAEALERAVHAHNREHGASLQLSHEAQVLGTAGGLCAAWPRFPAGPVLVHNADIEVALPPLHLPPEVVARLCVRPATTGRRGAVGLATDGRIVRLRETAVAEEAGSADYVGVALVGQTLRDWLSVQGCLVGDALIPALRAGARLDAVACAGDFFDLGTPAEYLRANLAWLEARGLSRWVHATAKVHASVRGCVIGAGAEVLAPLQESVVWPDQRVERAGSRVIVGAGVVVEAAAAVGSGR